ncbi:hypothetical protein TWF718_010487 [Orbilia javanica]|uniref:Uncharacterized protein n=1 Tax=Orbilia javanica TaxID=47235 RepID=A0AAN8MPB9_9PEZI
MLDFWAGKTNSTQIRPSTLFDMTLLPPDAMYYLSKSSRNFIQRVSTMLAARSSSYLSREAALRIQARQFSSRRPPASQTPKNGNESKLDPDKIKGPGGLTLTQIGKLVQNSAARDRAHEAASKTSGATGNQTPKK